MADLAPTLRALFRRPMDHDVRALTRAAVMPHRMFATYYKAASDGRGYIVELWSIGAHTARGGPVQFSNIRVDDRRTAEIVAYQSGRVPVRVG